MILKIKGKKVDFFNSFALSLRYDSVASAFSFNYYFDPNNPDHKEIAKPCDYPIVEVEHNNEQLLRGYLLSNTFKHSSVMELAAFGGYSLPGVLEDVEIPTSLYPLQSNNLSLKQIAEKLLKPFDINLIVDNSVSSKVNSKFDVSTANDKQSIKSYLTELAAQKNIVISHNSNGDLWFTEAKTTLKPIINFEPGIPNTSMDLAINGQMMHSEITLQKQAAIEGGNAGEQSIKNPYASTVYRPKVKSQSSGDDNDTGKAAKNSLSEELKGIVLKIETDRWEIDGKIIKPNNTITVINPSLYLYNKTTFFIEQVDLKGSNTEADYRATLTCVLPEVYNNSTPKNIFK